MYLFTDTQLHLKGVAWKVKGFMYDPAIILCYGLQVKEVETNSKRKTWHIEM